MPDKKQNYALEFKNVIKFFGENKVLKDISFNVLDGEFFALLGKNGAGKTTLINCLCSITKEDSGEIFVFGEDIKKDPEKIKTQIGVVQQEIAFDPFLTPVETLLMIQGFFGLKKDLYYIDYLLEKLYLKDKANSPARSLSGGMKRRLMIAKALVHKPKIILLDEPTAGVDASIRQSLWEFFKEIREKQKTTIFLTTHYLEEAQNLAEKIVIIDKGQIILNSSKDDLMKSEKRIISLDYLDKNGNLINEKIEINSDEDIMQKIEPYKNIKNIQIKEPSLEEIFLKKVV